MRLLRIFSHRIHLLSCVVIIVWYAAQASNNGGTTVFLRCAETRVTASFTSAAVAVGHADKSVRKTINSPVPTHNLANPASLNG